MKKMKRSYTELMEIPTFIERFRYLKLNGKVGEETFGHNRLLNQALYTCPGWRKVRREVIIRDMGFDLGCEDHPIGKDCPVYVHHINPITVAQVLERNPVVLDPENLISTSYYTHEAIHYGDESLLLEEPPERLPNDMIPWR